MLGFRLFYQKYLLSKYGFHYKLEFTNQDNWNPKRKIEQKIWTLWSDMYISEWFKTNDLNQIFFFLFIASCNIKYHGFHPKTSPFSTRHIICVNCEFLSQLYQPIYLAFSYLNGVRHNSDIELCREQILFFFVVPEK